jgi:hypothetical protein
MAVIGQKGDGLQRSTVRAAVPRWFDSALARVCFPKGLASISVADKVASTEGADHHSRRR